MKPNLIERLALIAILLLAAYLRLNHLEWTEYKLDEANLSRLSLNLVRGVEFPLVGLGSSTGVVNLPLASWIFAIPYALSSSPFPATAFVALLNVAAVYGCYALTKRFFVPVIASNAKQSNGEVSGIASSQTARLAMTETAALIAALLFAVAPWAVIHSRKIWAQDLLPPLVIAWAWTGYLAFVERRPRWLIVHAVLLAAMIQIHFAPLYLIPVSSVWAIAFARRLRWKSVLAAVAIFAALFAPFIIADLADGASNIQRAIETLRQPAQVDDQSIHLAWLMATGQEMHALAGPQEFESFLASIQPIDRLLSPEGLGLSTVLGVLMLIGAALASIDVLRAARRRVWDHRAAVSFMLLTWLLLPVLLQVRHSLPVFLHYFIVLYPAQFVFVGLVYARLGSALRSETGVSSYVLRWALITFVAVIAVLQSIASLSLQEFVAMRATPGGFALPLGLTLQVVDEALQMRAQSDAAEVLIYTQGDNVYVHELPSVFDMLLSPDVPRRFVDLAQAALVSPHDAAVMIWFAPSSAAQPDGLFVSDQGVSIPLRAGEQAARVWIWPGQQEPPCGESELGRWANGVTLLSVGWDVAGRSVELCYRVDAGEQVTDYHWFNHVLDQDGQRLAQIDGPGLSTVSWRVGDVVHVRFGPFDLPPDTATSPFVLRVGMYSYPDILNVALIDAAGNAVGESLEVDLNQPLP